MNKKTALVVIMNGVEELEAVAPTDCLRRAEIEVTVASVSESNRVTGRNQIVLEADCLLSDLEKSPYDLVLIPGGPGHKELTENKAVLSLLRSQHQRGGLIGSICAGPVVLDKAGVLEGITFTSFPGTADQLPRREKDPKVIRDRNIITAQGAGCATEFALDLVEALCGPDKRREIAASICA